MKIFISESDRQNAKRVALMSLAKFYNITDCDFTQIEESQINSFFTSLHSLNDPNATEIIKLTREYFTAYDKWFDFYQVAKKKEKENKKEYFFNEQEQLQLSKLIKKREESLNALQEKFDSVQLSRFNKNTFGKEMSGTIN